MHNIKVNILFYLLVYTFSVWILIKDKDKMLSYVTIDMVEKCIRNIFYMIVQSYITNAYKWNVTWGM